MERSVEESSDVYECDDNIMLTTSVADATNVIKMGFLSKVFGVVTAQFLCLAMASVLQHLGEGFHHTLSEFVWMQWIFLPMLAMFLMLMSQFRTSSPINLVFLALMTFCMCCVLTLTSALFPHSRIMDTVKLFLVQQTFTFLSLTISCLVSRADFSFRRAFYIAAAAGVFCLTALHMKFPSISPVAVVAAFLVALLQDAYILWNLCLQCEELCPAAYDIAIVGLFTQVDLLIGNLFKQFSGRKSSLTRRNSLYSSL